MTSTCAGLIPVEHAEGLAGTIPLGFEAGTTGGASAAASLPAWGEVCSWNHFQAVPDVTNVSANGGLRCQGVSVITGKKAGSVRMLQRAFRADAVSDRLATS